MCAAGIDPVCAVGTDPDVAAVIAEEDGALGAVPESLAGPELLQASQEQGFLFCQAALRRRFAICNAAYTVSA